MHRDQLFIDPFLLDSSGGRWVNRRAVVDFEAVTVGVADLDDPDLCQAYDLAVQHRSGTAAIERNIENKFDHQNNNSSGQPKDFLHVKKEVAMPHFNFQQGWTGKFEGW